MENNYSLRYFEILTVFDNVLFHVDILEFTEKLREKGYNIIAKPPLPSFGGIPMATGLIAQKRPRTFIRVNSDKKLIGILSFNIDDCLAVFNEVREILRELKPNIKPKYHELLSEISTRTSRDAILAVNSFSLGIEEKISSIVNHDLALYSFKLASRNRDPDTTNWLEIDIRPHFSLHRKALIIRIVYRDENSDKIVKFAQNTLNIVKNILKTLQA